jgi:hypothetical protein
MILSLYARLMCRLIWAARRILPAKDGALPNISWLRRDWEWDSDHECEQCGHRGRHHFIAWMDEDVTTAECLNCRFEATI